MSNHNTVWGMKIQVKNSVVLLASIAILIGMQLGWITRSKDILHVIGIVGTALMVWGQLYTVRKRTRLFRSWKIKKILEQHSTFGLAGPVFVAAHTDMKFHGMGGISAALMIIVVASGFVGRYIYRRVPTSAKKKEVEKVKKELQARCAEIEEGSAGPARSDLDLEKRIRRLEKELAYYNKMKKLLSNWRAIHWPLTYTFFTTVALHIFSVYYYGGGL